MASNFTKNVISAIDIKNVKYNIKAIPFHATEAEWDSISYIPKQGEFIVYDVDNNNTSPRFKTGDGVTDVKNLPFTLATISEVQAYVNSQIGSAGHLKRIILEEGAELPDISEADADTIYMKRNNESRLVSDVFDEYMAINGAWEIIGNTKVDLSNYVTQEQLNEEITEWVGDTVVSEQISTAIRSHNISSVAHSSIREKALCVQELPYLISGTVNDLRIHPSVIYGNGKYISIDAALWNIRTSIDGINWETSVTVPVMGSYHAGIYGNGKYVFISMNNELGYPIALYSEDAINWNYNKIEFTFNGEVISPEVWDKIVFENGIFILSGSAPVIIYSEDAISWTCSNEFLYNGSQLRPHTICYGNDKYVAFSNSTVSNILPVFTSTDAITWTANEIDLSLLSQEILEVLYPAPPTNFNYNMTYANNTFVAIFGHKVTATSTDGVNWNFAANLPYLGVWRNITYKNGTFVTVADNNELRKSIAAYSTDGTTWNIADKFGNPLKVEWLHLISGEDKFLITSENGQLAYSSDGINWTYAIKSVATLFSEEKTSDLKEVLGVGDPIYVAEESTDTSAEVINADTLGGYSASDFRKSDWLPTITEIGAAPAGYGLGGSATLIKINELDKTTKNGWYKFETGGTFAGVTANYGLMVCIVYSDRLLRQLAFLSDDNATSFCRQMRGGVWSGWVRCDPSAFAPAGFGLGGSAVSIAAGDNLNNYKVGGWYQFTKGVVNAPFDYGMMLIIHGSDYNNQTFQYAFSRYPANNMAIRQLFDSSWGEWEWINPPMVAGVEYRTTERYNGKPVYAKLIAFGTLPNTGNKDVAFYSDETVRPISIETQVGKQLDSLYLTIPAKFGNQGWYASAVNYKNIRITTEQDNSDLQARVLVKYWKSTD